MSLLCFCALTMGACDPGDNAQQRGDSPEAGGKADGVNGGPAGVGTPGWTVGASTDERSRFSATLLEDNRVLVAGGSDDSYPSESDRVQIYDVDGDAWSDAASLNVARYSHVATTLADGRVLVTGGYGYNDSANTRTGLTSAEIYDPNADTWTPAAHMSRRRYLHSATLLADGRVLVVGGQHAPSYYTETRCEIYDPTADSWSDAAMLETGRQEHTAHMLTDGRVAVIGGYNQFTERGVPEVSVYDPVGDDWEIIGALEYPRWRHDSVFSSTGDLLVFGGSSNYVDATGHPERIDLQTGVIETLAPMAYARQAVSATRIGGSHIALLGGGQRYGATSDRSPPAELYRMSDDTWLASTEVPLALREHRALPAPSAGVVVVGVVEDPDQLQVLTYGLDAGAPTPQVPLLSEDHWIATPNRGADVPADNGAVKFDHTLQTLVNFPGREEENVPIGTYAWQGGGWQEIVSADASPVPPRTRHTMAYDRSRGRMVMFGGLQRQGLLLNDVWEFDGTTWQEIEPSDDVQPDPSAGATFVYDSARQEMLLLPGSDGLNQLTTMYAWDGDRWRVRDQGSFAPWTDQRRYVAAFDDARGLLVLYQQGAYLTNNSETWQFNGQNWSSVASGPGNRHSTALVYDEVRQGVILFGGSQYNPYGGNLTQSDTWIFDGSWRELEPEGNPGTRAGHALAYDYVQGRVVLDDVGWPVGNSGRFELRQVEIPNRAPTISYVSANQTAYANERFSIELGIEDADGHDVDVWVEGMPAGADYVLNAEVFEWTPSPEHAGVHELVFHAFDGVRDSTRQITLTVEGTYAFAGLPQGTIAHESGVSVDGHWGEPDQYGWDMDPAQYTVRCEFAGDNPGFVSVQCTVREPDWPYSVRPVGSGFVAEDSTFSTSGGVRGRLEALQWDDFQMVVTSVDARPYTNRRATFSGEAAGYLDPM